MSPVAIEMAAALADHGKFQYPEGHSSNCHPTTFISKLTILTGGGRKSRFLWSSAHELYHLGLHCPIASEPTYLKTPESLATPLGPIPCLTFLPRDPDRWLPPGPGSRGRTFRGPVPSPVAPLPAAIPPCYEGAMKGGRGRRPPFSASDPASPPLPPSLAEVNSQGKYSIVNVQYSACHSP